MVRVRSNRVCFTVNNYEIADIDSIISYSEKPHCKFIVVGQEIGENGTPHLQGFVHIEKDPKQCGIKFWKEEIKFTNAAHYENARGSDQQNYEYCTKDGPFFAFGEPQEAGDIWSSIVQDCKTLPFEEIASKYPEQIIKHGANIRSLIDEFQRPTMDASLENLRPWQHTVLEKLENQSERKILFVVDEQGGKGKSVLAKHIFTNKNAWACQGGKINDLMYAYDTSAEYVVFDMARCNNPDYYPWNFMENLKNGWFTSTKYKGGMKTFKTPKIIVFMNQHPPMDKLSHDRFEIYKI